MFKRLFFLSFVIAFLLAGLAMWFWYLPMKQAESTRNAEVERVILETDTIPDPAPE